MTNRDWTGNKRSNHATIGSRVGAQEEREQNDYYATDPRAVELLLEQEKFAKYIWEPACGEGHISKVLLEHGYCVLSSDLVYRGYGVGRVDFLKERLDVANTDIITNPPYKFALEFAQKALDLIEDGHKVALFLRIQFLEGKKRRKFFEKNPPKVVYVASDRLQCAKNGDFASYQVRPPVCYAWFVWEKGYTGEPVVRWFN